MSESRPATADTSDADVVSPGMAARVATFDWSTTALGPMAGWPASLRTAVGICLNNRFPMFVWWGPDLVNIYNDAYAPMLGKRHPDSLGAEARNIWSEIWTQVGPQTDAVMLRGESTWNERVLLVMERNGFSEEAWFTWSYNPIPGEDGVVDGLFCVCREDTASVIAERERDRLTADREHLLHVLQAERENLAAVVEQAPSFIAVFRGPDHTYELANEEYYELIGRRDVIGRTIRDVLPEVEGQGFFEMLDTVYRTGEPCVGNEAAVALNSGPDASRARRIVNFVFQPLRGPDGEISGLFVHGVDVTEPVKSREAFRAGEAHFREIADALEEGRQHLALALDAGRLGTWRTDIATRELTCSDTCKANYGRAAGEPFTYDMLWAGVHPDDRERTRAAMRHAIETGEDYVAEYRNYWPDDTLHWAAVRGRTTYADDGTPLHVSGVSQDITDRKRTEAEREQLLVSERAARNESELQGRMKDEFLATLSHEIRTPLNAILGWSQIMRSSSDPDDVASGLEVIERNARAQSQIVEDLLDMSRIISGKVRLDVQRLDLAAVVQSAVETARPTAEAKGVRLKAVVDPLHGVSVSGDANRLQQVMWNLISNAIKFTPRGGSVHVLLERVSSHLQITVIDTGEGIAPAFLPFVFDRFRQADASTTRRHGGLGLGLSIVRQLVELHGGSVRVHSAGPDAGSTFTVALPLIALHPEPEPNAHTDHPRLARGPASTPGTYQDITGVRVLVIDDEADARTLVKRLLEDRGALVTATASIDETVDLIRTRGYDVLVSDIGMPGEDGYSLIKRVRLLGKADGGDIPAIALTAYARAEDRVKAVAAGFLMHVAKPVEPVELITMVAGAAGRTGPVAMTPQPPGDGSR